MGQWRLSLCESVIADYIRFFEYEPEGSKWPTSAFDKTYREGYGTAAAFLNRVAETCDVRLIERLT